MLLLLFAAGYVGRRRIIKENQAAAMGYDDHGMVVLGFIFNQPLTISKINMFFLGYWPEWQLNLYWYVLLGGILFVFTADNRNPTVSGSAPLAQRRSV